MDSTVKRFLAPFNAASIVAFLLEMPLTFSMTTIASSRRAG